LDGEPCGPQDHHHHSGNKDEDRTAFESFKLLPDFLQHVIQRRRGSPWGLIPFSHNLPPVHEPIGFIDASLFKVNTIDSH
jgi:hypothetical protein